MPLLSIEPRTHPLVLPMLFYHVCSPLHVRFATYTVFLSFHICLISVVSFSCLKCSFLRQPVIHPPGLLHSTISCYFLPSAHISPPMPYSVAVWPVPSSYWACIHSVVCFITYFTLLPFCTCFASYASFCSCFSSTFFLLSLVFIICHFL